MRHGIKKAFGRFMVLTAVGSTLVLGTGGCPDDLFDVAIDAFQTGYDIGSGYSDDDWGGGYDYDYGSGYGSSGDGYYNNFYTDTAMNGDSEGFYIAGDGFTYTSGW